MKENGRIRPMLISVTTEEKSKMIGDFEKELEIDVLGHRLHRYQKEGNVTKSLETAMRLKKLKETDSKEQIGSDKEEKSQSGERS